MEPRRASETAAFTAMLRAAHQLFDAEPRILVDPLAVGLVDAATPARLAERQAALREPTLRVPRSAIVLRSRFAEDELARVAAHGVGQYVVLGAGLDTFAYRQPAFAARLRIFEVDHPATQAWKRERLAAAAIPIPPNLHWAPIDFEQQSLAEGLRAAGFDPTQAACFSWLGVTQYLSRAAIEATLGVVAALPHPTTVVLSFMVPDDAAPEAEAAAAHAAAQDAATTGEPWLTRFRPA